jgi:hypothetical protein
VGQILCPRSRHNRGMRNSEIVTFPEMRPVTRWATIFMTLFTIAIPLGCVNLLICMPNHMWAIFAGQFVAIAASRIAFVVLQRRA